MGRYTFAHQIGVAVNFQDVSGWTYTRLMSVTLPNAGSQNFFLEDFNQRAPAVPLLSVRADKAFTFAKCKVTVMADVFNILNKNTPINFGVLNGAAFNRIYAALDPRTLQLGFRFEF
jgi:hypothetical protein